MPDMGCESQSSLGRVSPLKDDLGEVSEHMSRAGVT